MTDTDSAYNRVARIIASSRAPRLTASMVADAVMKEIDQRGVHDEIRAAARMSLIQIAEEILSGMGKSAAELLTDADRLEKYRARKFPKMRPN